MVTVGEAAGVGCCCWCYSGWISSSLQSWKGVKSPVVVAEPPMLSFLYTRLAFSLWIVVLYLSVFMMYRYLFSYMYLYIYPT